MHLKFAILVLASLLLSGCDHNVYTALDTLTQQSTGHAAVPDALLAQNQPVESISSSSASQEPIVVVTPSSSSSEYVQPLGEPCDPGTFGFRLWTCVDGHRSYI